MRWPGCSRPRNFSRASAGQNAEFEWYPIEHYLRPENRYRSDDNSLTRASDVKLDRPPHTICENGHETTLAMKRAWYGHNTPNPHIPFVGETLREASRPLFRAVEAPHVAPPVRAYFAFEQSSDTPALRRAFHEVEQIDRLAVQTFQQ